MRSGAVSDSPKKAAAKITVNTTESLSTGPTWAAFPRRVALVVVVGLDVPERFRELLSQVCHVGPPQGVE